MMKKHDPRVGARSERSLFGGRRKEDAAINDEFDDASEGIIEVQTVRYTGTGTEKETVSKKSEDLKN